MRQVPLSARLHRLIRERRADEPDLRMAALFTLDAVGSILGGCATQPGRILLDWWRASGASPRDPGRAAFLMGGLCHILEMDDLHRASVVHPGCVVVPAVLGLAARDPGRFDGRTCLEAVLRGFEAACRIGIAVGRRHYKLFHNTATCGPFGSAAAAAGMLALTDEQAVHAFGNAGTQSAGFWQFLDTGAMSKHLHAGRGAEAGLVAAMLADRGFTGAPEILEGERGFFRAMCPDGDPDLVLADPDGPWQLALTSIKPWPCCRHTHPVIDAAEEIRREMATGGVHAADIQHVTIRTYQAALDLCDRPAPLTDYDAKFSLQHTAAAALSQNPVWFNSFDENSRAELQGLRERVVVSADSEFEQAYPVAWGARVSVETPAGTFQAHRRAALGDPELPLSEDRLIDKARRLILLGGHRDPHDIISQVLEMAEGGPVPDLLPLLLGHSDAPQARASAVA